MPYSNLSKLIRIQRAWRRVLRLKTNKKVFESFINLDLNLNSARGRSIQSLRTFLASTIVSEVSRTMFVRLLTLCVFKHRVNTISKYPGRIDHHLVAYIIAAHPGYHFLGFGTAESNLFHAAVRLVRSVDTLIDAFKASDMRIRRVPLVLTREYPEVLLSYMVCYREWSHTQSRARACQGALCYLSDLMSMDISSQPVRDDITIVRRRIMATMAGDNSMARIDGGYVPDDCWSLLHRLHYFTVGVISKEELAHELCIDPMFAVSGTGFAHQDDRHEVRFAKRRKMFWELVRLEMFQCPRRFDHLLRAVAELRGGICELGCDPSFLDLADVEKHLVVNEGRYTIQALKPISTPILTFLSRHLEENVHDGWDHVQCRLAERNDARIVLPNLVSYCLKRLETIFAARCNFKLRTLAPLIVPLAPGFLRQCFEGRELKVTQEWVRCSMMSLTKNRTMERLHAVGLSKLVFSVPSQIPETLVHDQWRIELLRNFFSSSSNDIDQLQLQGLLEAMLSNEGVGCAIAEPWRTSLETLCRISRVSILVHGQRYASMIDSLV